MAGKTVLSTFLNHGWEAERERNWVCRTKSHRGTEARARISSKSSQTGFLPRRELLKFIPFPGLCFEAEKKITQTLEFLFQVAVFTENFTGRAVRFLAGRGFPAVRCLCRGTVGQDAGRLSDCAHLLLVLIFHPNRFFF